MTSFNQHLARLLIAAATLFSGLSMAAGSFRLAPRTVPGGPGLSSGGRRRRHDAGGKPMPAFMAQVLVRAEASLPVPPMGTPVSELQAVYKTIPELFAPRPGQPLAMTIEAEFWGETGNGIPFWMGVREMEMDTSLAAGALKSDAHGNSDNQGALLMMVAAYTLDRDTGIRASLLTEAVGDSRRDIKTESTQFNALYHITVRGGDEAGPETGVRLQQALTPATQTRLLDLWERYRLQIIIDGPVVFVSGYERINTRDADILVEKLPLAAHSFALAASSFKHYVE